MSGKDSWWDNNPFLGRFDYNNDGKEDSMEQIMGIHSERMAMDNLQKEIEQRNERFQSQSNYFSSNEDKYDSFETGTDLDIELELYGLEDTGSYYGLHMDDYLTTEDFIEALYKAKENEGRKLALKGNVATANADDENDDEDEIKESDYPNKRRYEAAYAYYLNEGSRNKEIKKQNKCCRFILDNADTLIAANYLSYEDGFLYAQAVKDNFELPVSLPDEDECREYNFSDIIKKIARKDFTLAFKVWEWCIEQFLPYAEYDIYGTYTLCNEVMEEYESYSKKFQLSIIAYLKENPAFKETVLNGCPDVLENFHELIAGLLEHDALSLAEEFFKCNLVKAGNKWKVIKHIVDDTIGECETYDELEKMEYFKLHFFPYVKAVNIDMIQDEIEEWEERIDEYITEMEDECEKYAYSRKNAWRNNVPDGEEYSLNPCDYSSKEEYMSAFDEAKYEWRKEYSDEDCYGVDPNAYETEKEFVKAVEKMQREYERMEQIKEERLAQIEMQELRQKQAQAEKLRIEARQRKIDADKEKNRIVAQKYLEDLADLTVYTYCSVVFDFMPRPLSYRTDDETIRIGDRVIVPLGQEQKETEGTVVSIGHYMRVATPYPIEKTKFIIKKLTDVDVSQEKSRD